MFKDVVTSSVPLTLWALGSLFDHLDCSHFWVEAVGWWLTSLEARWEEEDSLLTDNESFANQLELAILYPINLEGLHCWHGRALKGDPNVR